jgi:MFS superfamily sulfate permease-like transporter
LADQNPVQRATFVAKAAADQVKRTEKKVDANEMPQVQLALAEAIAKEAAALAVLTYAESLLISPDEKVVDGPKNKSLKPKKQSKKQKKIREML